MDDAKRYLCERGDCSGHRQWILVGDRDSHNKYHDAVDNGYPNPYEEGFDNDVR